MALWVAGTLLGSGKVIDGSLLNTIGGIAVLCLVGYIIWRIRSLKKKQPPFGQETSFKSHPPSNSGIGQR